MGESTATGIHQVQYHGMLERGQNQEGQEENWNRCMNVLVYKQKRKKSSNLLGRGALPFICL